MAPKAKSTKDSLVAAKAAKGREVGLTQEAQPISAELTLYEEPPDASATRMLVAKEATPSLAQQVPAEQTSRKRRATYNNSKPSPWKPFFERMPPCKDYPGGSWRCKECWKQGKVSKLKFSDGCTTPRKNHMLGKHHNFCEEQGLVPSSGQGGAGPSAPQASIRGFARGENPRFSYDKWWKMVVKWIVSDDQLFTIVESPYLRKMLLMCHPKAKLPDGSAVPGTMAAMMAELQPKVKKLIHDAHCKVSFTSSQWTDPDSRPFMCFTAHFVAPGWRPRSVLLGFRQLEWHIAEQMVGQQTEHQEGQDSEKVKGEGIEQVEGRCTPVARHKAFTELVTGPQWEIEPENWFGVTFDDAPTNAAFAQELKRKNDFNVGHAFPCLAHIINLAAHRLLDDPQVHPVLEQVREISRYVSAWGHEEREESWGEACGRTLQLDVGERWKSSKDMLHRALELRHKMAAWCSALPTDEERAAMGITDEQWEQIHVLTEVLEPLAMATEVACESDQPISFVLPLYNHAYYSLKDLAEVDKYLPFKEAILAAAGVFEHHYAPASRALSAASILDPRVNVGFFTAFAHRDGHGSAEDIQGQVREELRGYLEEDAATEPRQSASTPSGRSKFSFLFGPPRAAPAAAEPGDELAQYCNEPRIDDDQSPYLWWRVNGGRYPKLERAAREYLGARPTSADAEWVFNGGGEMAAAFQRNLEPESLMNRMMLKSWLNALEGDDASDA